MDDQARGGPRPGEGNEQSGLSPVRAFFLLGAILAAVFAGFLATREESPATETVAPARSPDYSLTDAEAIAEFERLNDTRITAYRLRDISLLHQALASDSPLLRRGEAEIKQLLRDKIILKSRFGTEAAEVVTNMPDEIVVRHTEVDYPRFVHESGDVLTADRTPRLRVILWTLRPIGTEWRIFDSTFVSQRAIEK